MITVKLAHGVALTSPRHLGHPARAGFCFGPGTKKKFVCFLFSSQPPFPHGDLDSILLRFQMD